MPPKLASPTGAADPAMSADPTSSDLMCLGPENVENPGPRRVMRRSFATCVNRSSPGRHRRVTALAPPPATWPTIQSRTAPQTSSTVPATARVTGPLASGVYMILARRSSEPSPSRQTRRTRTATGSVLGIRRLSRGSVTGPSPTRCRDGLRTGERPHGNVGLLARRLRNEGGRGWPREVFGVVDLPPSRPCRVLRRDGQAHAHARVSRRLLAATHHAGRKRADLQRHADDFRTRKRRHVNLRPPTQRIGETLVPRLSGVIGGRIHASRRCTIAERRCSRFRASRL
jgi:hypothetical protein